MKKRQKRKKKQNNNRSYGGKLGGKEWEQGCRTACELTEASCLVPFSEAHFSGLCSSSLSLLCFFPFEPSFHLFQGWYQTSYVAKDHDLWLWQAQFMKCWDPNPELWVGNHHHRATSQFRSNSSSCIRKRGIHACPNIPICTKSFWANCNCPFSLWSEHTYFFIKFHGILYSKCLLFPPGSKYL